MKDETLEESLNKSLKKSQLEIERLTQSVKHDQERLSYFTHVKEYLENELKSIEVDKNKEGLSEALIEDKEDWTKTSANRQ